MTDRNKTVRYLREAELNVSELIIKMKRLALSMEVDDNPLHGKVVHELKSLKDNVAREIRMKASE